MATAPNPRRLSPEEYLAIERKAEYKSEYFDGEVFAKSGAGREHNLISVNLGGEIRQRLRGGPCVTYLGDMRVLVSSTGLCTYPDVVVVCDAPRFQDAEVDILLNPTVVVEVLSPSTMAYDRGRKFDHYRTIDTIREYILVEQDRPVVVRFTRLDGRWVARTFDRLDADLEVESLGIAIPLRDVYERIDFAGRGDGG